MGAVAAGRAVALAQRADRGMVRGVSCGAHQSRKRTVIDCVLPSE